MFGDSFHGGKIFRSKGKRVRNLNSRNYSKVDWPWQQHFHLVKLNFNQWRAICCINVSLTGESSSLHIFLIVPKAMAPAVSPLRHLVSNHSSSLYIDYFTIFTNFLFYYKLLLILARHFIIRILIIPSLSLT